MGKNSLNKSVCILVLLLFCLQILQCKKKEPGSNDVEYNSSDVQKYIKVNYGEIKSFNSLTKSINKLLHNKKKNIETDSNDTTDIDVTEVFIGLLTKYEKSNLNTVIRYYVLLFQYIDASNDEYLCEILGEHFYNNTNVVIDVLTDIEKYLMDEFNNQDFINYLYVHTCRLPSSITEKTDYNSEKEKRKLIIRLKNMENKNNKKVIEYLLEKKEF